MINSKYLQVPENLVNEQTYSPVATSEPNGINLQETAEAIWARHTSGRFTTSYKSDGHDLAVRNKIFATTQYARSRLILAQMAEKCPFSNPV